jgi:hypothetical protein
VGINFYPCQNRISKELETCTSVQSLERLLGFCRSCIYRIFEEAQGMNPVPMTYSREADAILIGGGIRQIPDNERLLNV